MKINPVKLYLQIGYFLGGLAGGIIGFVYWGVIGVIICIPLGFAFSYFLGSDLRR
jgi:hypothetical protein